MTQLPQLLYQHHTLVIVLLVIIVGILFLLTHYSNSTQRKPKNRRPIDCQDFLVQWDVYRKADTSGCYIILIYKHRPSARNIRLLRRFDNVYIGQSVNMYRRVYNHFTGHGNGDVYADVKYHRFVYVKFIPCRPERLNACEKQLISEFDATSSYNRTKGGAKLTLTKS